MEYLTVHDLYELNIIDYGGEKLLLVETDSRFNPVTKTRGDISKTFIKESVEKNDGEYVDKDADVYIKERWLVDVLPSSAFERTFTTHRYIEVYYCKYEELIKQEEWRSRREYHPASKVDTNELGDSFTGF